MHGLVKARKSRVRQVPQTAPLSHCVQPNDVWSSDFKGQFRLGNGRYCYPLTVTDNCSRMLLVCKGLYAPTETGVVPWFERAFREYGLPCAMRTDNGSPFASTALAGLTRLNIWWLKLGIKLERIQPGRPQQNGRHERMHRTLKEETAKPSKGNMLLLVVSPREWIKKHLILHFTIMDKVSLFFLRESRPINQKRITLK